jgi:hypothetical protein
LAVVASGILAVVFVAGWLVRDWTQPSRQLTVSSTFAGTVTFVNGGGVVGFVPTAGCIKPDHGGGNADQGGQICSGFIVTPGTVLRAGERVHAAHVWTHAQVGGQSGHDQLVVYPLASPPGS